MSFGFKVKDSLLSPSQSQDEVKDQLLQLSIEEEMEELVPELKKSKRMRRGSNISDPSVAVIFRLLIGIFTVCVIGFGVYILVSAPPQDPTSKQSKKNESLLKNTHLEMNSSLKSSSKTLHPMTLFNKIPLHTGYMSKSYKWISHPNYPDGTFIEFDWQSFILNHVEFKNTTILASKQDFKDSITSETIYFENWKVSPDLSHILVSTNTVDGWRHSNFADYYLFNIETKSLKLLNTSRSDKFIPHEIGSGKISMTIWSPQGHNVAWVRDNDLFVTLDGTKEIRITTDGSKNIINGIADWVYEEEVLAQHEASWFSDDGRSLTFIKFDDSNVKEYELQYYSKFGENSYPTLIDIKYPKPGTPNPLVSLHIASFSADGNSMTQYTVNFGDDGFAFDDRIITEVVWVGSEALLVRMMNRVQDHQKVYLINRSASSTEWTVKLVRDEKSPDQAWFQNLQALTLVKSTNPAKKSQGYSYIEISDINNDLQTHLAFYETLESSKPTYWITSGPWEVTALKRIDQENGIVYYLSTEKGSTERHLYSISLTGKDKKLISSNGPAFEKIVDQVPGSLGLRADAGFYDADFSPQCTFYVLAYLGPDVPWERLQKTKNEKFGSFLADWKTVRKSLSEWSYPRVKYITVPNGVGDEMNIKLILPPDFDDSGATKYPVLFHVYGGPNSQMVSMKYEVNYMSKMACLNMISMIVDGRGTGFKGRKYRASVSTRLGELEAFDQVAAAKWAASQNYIDGKKIGIWGWSYGGYLTSKVIETNSGAFALGMAVAPVTDWKFYDTVYTERYMKTPQINPQGYKKAAVTEMEGFKNSKFLMIHGTADDNVHFQNSAELVWHLTGAHVDSYTVQFYTDSDHSINANGAQSQVYDKLTKFICKEFQMNCKLI